eukprot:scaffold97121_cov46-Attheya_sp.AAC.2
MEDKKKRERPIRVPIHPWGWWGEEREQDSDEDEDDYFEYFDNGRTFEHPDIPDFTPPVYKHVSAEVSLKDRPLQVIVKIASLEVEPGQSYGGGVWHVEGTLDEHIVATACCYVDCENVQGGELQFRTAVSAPYHEQSDTVGVSKGFSLEDGGFLVQPCGASSVPTRRVLVWPNTLQHCVSGVRLDNESQPGRRTIICFFLVDPTLRVRSTATVPPQQKEWLRQEVSSVFHSVFPQEIISHICSYLPAMTYDQACERRNKLMEERSAAIEDHGFGDSRFYEQMFSLCEH